MYAVVIVELHGLLCIFLCSIISPILKNPSSHCICVHTHTHTQSSIDVTISANDNPSGIFSLVPAFLSLTEDETPSGTISIRRSPGLLGEVTLTWEVVPAIETFVVEMDTVTFGPGDTAVDIPLQLQSNVVRTLCKTIWILSRCI